jgi:hypothetical protein
MEQKMRGLASRGVFANPVVPVLVNLVEPEVFAIPEGIDWDRSRLESQRPAARVTIFYPDHEERSNDFARVFELILNQTPEAAQATYDGYINRFWCEDALLGMSSRHSKGKGALK